MTDRLGVRLGIDPGEARIGVAYADPYGILASPLDTVPRGEGDLAALARLVAEHDADLVYVGLPRSLRGGEGPSAARVREFAAGLAERLAPVPVHLVDERLSTVTAEGVLREQGRKGRRRRAVVDQAAAVVILQAALDTERTSGRAVGERVPAPSTGASDG